MFLMDNKYIDHRNACSYKATTIGKVGGEEKCGQQNRLVAVSACATKYCHRDFVLKYVVIGGKKDFWEESGLFRDLFWSRSGPFVAICTKMLKIMRKHDDPISRRGKVHKSNLSAANIHIFQFVAPGLFLHSTWNFNSLGPIYRSIVTNQTTSGFERQIGPLSVPYLDIGPDRDQVPKSGVGTLAHALYSTRQYKKYSTSPPHP